MWKQWLFPPLEPLKWLPVAALPLSVAERVLWTSREDRADSFTPGNSGETGVNNPAIPDKTPSKDKKLWSWKVHLHLQYLADAVFQIDLHINDY